MIVICFIKTVFLSDPGPIIVYPSQWLTHSLTQSRPCWRFNELTFVDGIKYLSDVDIEMKFRFSCHQLVTSGKAGNSCNSCWPCWRFNELTFAVGIKYLSDVDIEMKLRFSCHQLVTSGRAGNSCNSCQSWRQWIDLCWWNQISKRCWHWNEIEVYLPTACNIWQSWQ